MSEQDVKYQYNGLTWSAALALAKVNQHQLRIESHEGRKLRYAEAPASHEIRCNVQDGVVRSVE